MPTAGCTLTTRLKTGQDSLSWTRWPTPRSTSASFPGATTAGRSSTVWSFRVAAGELVAIVGESGSGKSTLLNLIAGLDQPDAGHILIGGQDLAALDDDARTRLRRARLGFVFQSFHILPHLRIGQNIELPLVLLGVAASERQQRVAELLAAVGLADRAASLPRELSGGELQRVAVARALVHRPVLVLADEPTGNLDAETAAMVMQLLVDADPRARCGRRARHALGCRCRTRRPGAGAQSGPPAAAKIRRRTEMLWIWWQLIIRYAWTYRLRTAVQVLAITVGVALGYAVSLINTAALAEFNAALREINGEADAVIEGSRAGFDEQLFARVASASGCAAGQPGAGHRCAGGRHG